MTAYGKERITTVKIQTMPGITLPRNWYQWVKKMEALAEYSMVSYDLILQSFKTAMDYYGSDNKDINYWCDVLFKRCCVSRVEMLNKTDWNNYPDLIESIERSKTEELDLSTVDEEMKQTLIDMAKVSDVKLFYTCAGQLVRQEMLNFMDIHLKHPFDWVLDQHEDFETFFKIETALRQDTQN